MRQLCTGQEKLHIFLKRAKIRKMDFAKILGSGVTIQTVSRWISGTMIPTLSHKRMIHRYTRDYKMEYKELNISIAPHMWTKVSPVQVCVWELLEIKRRRAGLSAEAASKIIGCARPVFSLWENGNNDPAAKYRTRIENVFGIKKIYWEIG